MNNKNPEFIRHTGDECPVRAQARVIYRTMAKFAPGRISHVHGAVEAGQLIWTKKPTLGRIYDYAVVRP